MKDDRISPPRAARLLLKRLLLRRNFPAVAGDFEELFQEIAAAEGLRQARRWYWRHVLTSLPAFVKNGFLGSLAMLGNYVKVTLRSISRHRGYAFINVAGLALGMASCILLLFWTRDELSFDRFHEHADEVYRAVNISEGVSYLITPGGLGPALKTEVPEIIDTVRMTPLQRRLLQYQDRRFYEDDVLLADPSLFAVFTYPFIQGDPATALARPDAIVLTESLAGKYFGGEEALGKILRIGGSEDCLVTGVIQDVPSNSHIRFSAVRSFEILPERFRKWDNSQWHTYVRIEPHIPPSEVASKITACAHRYQPGADNHYELQPLKRVRLFSTGFQYDSALRGDIKYVYIFSLLAVFILLIACINFMNLTTARSGGRAKEIGIRKVVGARRRDVIKQFLGESVVFTSLAFILAVVMVGLALPVFNRVSGKALTYTAAGKLEVLGILFGVAIVTGLIAGTYPAFVLSAFRPVRVLRGTWRSGAVRAFLRKLLVVFQFALTVILLIGTFVIFKQIRYMQNKHLGFDKDHIIYMPMRGNLREKYASVKAELLKNPLIVDVTSSYVPVGIGSGAYGIWEGKQPEDEVHMYVAAVDYNFLDFFNMEMAAGRFFSQQYPTDAREAFVVNEAAIRAMKMSDPIGQRFAIAGNETAGRIIGVVKDFHYRPLHNEIEPFIFVIRPQEFWQLVVKLRAGQTTGALGFLKEKWKDLVPGFPLDYRFVDETLKSRYLTERRMGTLFRYFTGLAVFIACLGLFGLASFVIAARTKEIGIRKILGASDPGIAAMLTKEFSKWVLLANVVAWPLAYGVMRRWLQGFAYRTHFDLGVFAASAGVALLMAVLTIGFQALRAARSDPVDSLRYE